MKDRAELSSEIRLRGRSDADSIIDVRAHRQKQTDSIIDLIPFAVFSDAGGV